MSLATLRVDARLEGALRAGHPWVYRDALRSDAQGVADGAWVRVEVARSGSAAGASAVGLYSAEGAIAVRLFRFAPHDAVPDEGWVRARVARALAQRAELGLGGRETDAYRLLYGEGDGFPGLTVDRYGRTAVLASYASSYQRAGSDAERLAQRVVRALAGGLRLAGVVRAAEGGLEVLYGEAPPPALSVSEQGLRFLVRPGTGQKTGLFLDQRENRATVRRFAVGRRVANLFAYTGGFSMHALAGGATSALDVDVAAGALSDAVANAAANGFSDRHATLKLDLMSDPRAALERSEFATTDFIVLDPPSFARNKAQRHAALRAYRRLNAAALARLPDGGLLATASCTAQVSPESFRQMLAEALSEAAAEQPGLEARVLHEAGHAGDHPVPLAFPEGRYLKFLLLRVDRSR